MDQIIPNESANQSNKVEKEVTIFINGSAEQVNKGEMTYEEIVTIAYPDFPQHPERNYSVKYKKGDNQKPEGILAPGGKVKVKNGMQFTVNQTGQS
ncbi:MAG: multiubiquitin domain-containing protein [Bacteroidetes bacterium]|nr:multiubiquitin domain-containing protein [Bacteroidota bacterium]